MVQKIYTYELFYYIITKKSIVCRKIFMQFYRFFHFFTFNSVIQELQKGLFRRKVPCIFLFCFLILTDALAKYHFIKTTRQSAMSDFITL